MSGWMKYPYIECMDCDRYDSDEDEDWAIVNHPYEACNYTTTDCPEKIRRKQEEAELGGDVPRPPWKTGE
jgi:hypothetical protein